jgi:cytochrome c-type biogenesis protein CcmF
MLVIMALAAMVTSTVSFFLASRGNSRYFNLGRISYYYFVALVTAACALLFYYFMTGDYSFKYVYDYSSSELPTFYLISAFWAGQQGTYLLWLFLFAVLGFYILKRGRQYTTSAMFFYSLINLFFLVILVVLSPFQKLLHPQPDGAGLNPLLQDPWMVIHPPVIFLGYAAVAIPCVIALAALLRDEYDGWLDIAFAPAALGALALAAGNIMGGFWAYKTLGWGGYWAWDPVENSSFIPWMTSLALIHGLIIERTEGALRRTNLFLGIFTFLLVIYGTFLTRSGVLADFSVHSFVDLGVNQYLIGFMIGFAVLALGLFFFRRGKIQGPALNMSVTGREFALLMSVLIMSLIAVMVLAGTSWPLITTVFGKPGVVDTAMYSRVTLPLAIVIGLFLGFSPFMLRQPISWGDLFKKVTFPVIGAVIITAVAIFAGVRGVSHILLIGTAALAFFSNLFALSRYLPNHFDQAGAQIAHFGFALMLIGILGSSAYTSSQKVSIERDSSAQALNLNIAYKGMAGDINTPNNKILLQVKDGTDQYAAEPRLYWSARQEGLMKKPYIRRHLLYDLYFAPEQVEEASEKQEGIAVRKGETIPVGPYSVTFVKFDQGMHAAGAAMKFGAVLEVTDKSGRKETIIPSQNFEAGKGVEYGDVPLMTGLDSMAVRLEKIQADQGIILLSIKGMTAAGSGDRLIIEVSKKPTMNILWLGTIVMCLGGLLALRSRWRLSARGLGAAA